MHSSADLRRLHHHRRAAQQGRCPDLAKCALTHLHHVRRALARPAHVLDLQPVMPGVDVGHGGDPASGGPDVFPLSWSTAGLRRRAAACFRSARRPTTCSPGRGQGRARPSAARGVQSGDDPNPKRAGYGRIINPGELRLARTRSSTCRGGRTRATRSHGPPLGSGYERIGAIMPHRISSRPARSASCGSTPRPRTSSPSTASEPATDTSATHRSRAR